MALGKAITDFTFKITSLTFTVGLGESLDVQGNLEGTATGFGPEARKLQEASKSMSCAAAAHLVPDEMARTFAACGTPNQVREWIEPLWQRANSMLLWPPTWGLGPEQLAAKTAAIAETFWIS